MLRIYEYYSLNIYVHSSINIVIYSMIVYLYKIRKNILYIYIYI